MRALLASLIAIAVAGSAGPAWADKDADASYKEGLAFKQEGKLDDAIKALEQAVGTNPKHVMAWASLGATYKQKKNTEKKADDAKHDLEKAIDAYEHATQLMTNPSIKEAPLWENLGMGYAQPEINRLDDALKALTQACKLDPKNAEYRANLGTVQRKKNMFAEAVTNLELAVKAKPDNDDWQHKLGVAYRFAKRDDDAIKAFQEAIRINGNDASYHFDLAVAYRRKQEVDKAIPEYERATSLDPNNADGWFDLGFMYKENHDNTKAVEAFKKYLELKKGKDPEGEKRITEECQALGGGCGKDDKKKTPPKKK